MKKPCRITVPQRTKQVANEVGAGYIPHCDAWQMNTEMLDRFAARIIRDCARVVFDNTGPRSALNVLEHFGLNDEE